MSGFSLRIGCRIVLAAMALSIVAGSLARAETVERFPDTSRVVSVGGVLTEIVYALGAEKMLVARDQTSTYPPAANDLPDIGYMRRLAPEGVLSVNPTGILLLEGSGPPDALDVLKRASVPMVVVPENHTVEGVTEKVEAVGKALGLEDKARVLAEAIRQDMEAAQKAVAVKKPRKRVLFVLSAGGGRIMASGTGTAADGIIALAGGVNAITEYPGYKQLTDEAVEKAAPDVIMMMKTGPDSTSNDELLKNPAFLGTPAGRDRNIIRMDGLYLLGFGPRTAKVIRDLSARLYPVSSGQ